MEKAKKQQKLFELEGEHASECPHCTAQPSGLNIVFGEGDICANIMFVGEGPGEEEDKLGRPFVGRSGKLLDKQIAAMGLNRGDVYIANVVKKRPPENRIPTQEEAMLCLPYLARQIDIIEPKVIVTLGATSAKYLLNVPHIAITKERGRWREYNGIPLMPTFHPAYLLRAYTIENREAVWNDLKAVLTLLGRSTPAAQ